MEIKGKVIQMLTLQQGQGKKGPWKKQEFIIETDGQYAKKICLAAWNDNIDKFAVRVGDNITAYLDIESRENNARWYTEVRVWKLEKTGYTQPAQQQSSPPPPTPNQVAWSSSTDDLPF
jgi:hypothetical protein